MSTSAMTFNPGITTVAQGTFGVDWSGAIAGTAMDSPSARNFLSAGVLSTSETLPMFGGIPIYEEIATHGYSATTTNPNLGNTIGRATTFTPPTGATGTTNAIGFSVFDQAHAMVNSPQSPVPLASSGMAVNFYRFGSGARIWVACDAEMANYEANSVTTCIMWDFKAQALTPYLVSSTTYALSAVTWSNASGGQIAATVATWAALLPGDFIDITGGTNTGTGGATAFNTTFQVVTATPAGAVTSIVLAAPAATGYYATLAGSPVATVTGGTSTVATNLIPTGTAVWNSTIKLLDLNIGNSMTVNYDPVSGFATWLRNSNCALIQI